MNSNWGFVLAVLVSLCAAWGCSERRDPKTQDDEPTTRNVAMQHNPSQSNAAPREEAGRDVGSIPYLQVYQLAFVPDNADFTSQDVRFYIKSNLANVSAERISLFVDGEDGRVPIAVDTHGGFTLPFSKEMLAENPEIISNQPKGSLSLECIVGQTSILLPECRAITYRKLVEPELLSRTIESIVDDADACSFPKVLVWSLDAPKTGSVVIHVMGATKEIPVSDGFFQITLSSDLMAENPLVVFPGPSRIVSYREGCGMPWARLSGRISNF